MILNTLIVVLHPHSVTWKSRQRRTYPGASGIWCSFIRGSGVSLIPLDLVVGWGAELLTIRWRSRCALSLSITHRITLPRQPHQSVAAFRVSATAFRRAIARPSIPQRIRTCCIRPAYRRAAELPVVAVPSRRVRLSLFPDLSLLASSDSDRCMFLHFAFTFRKVLLLSGLSFPMYHCSVPGSVRDDHEGPGQVFGNELIVGRPGTWHVHTSQCRHHLAYIWINRFRGHIHP